MDIHKEEVERQTVNGHTQRISREIEEVER